jgi:hypothetical protein
MNAGYTFESTLATAHRINWKVEDVIGRDHRPDFVAPAFCLGAQP